MDFPHLLYFSPLDVFNYYLQFIFWLLKFGPWVKIPWRRKWQPAPVFLPGESHRQRSLAGHGAKAHKEIETIAAT